jgi:hypothetical protein
MARIMKKLRVWLVSQLWLWEGIDVHVGTATVKDDTIPKRPEGVVILNEFVLNQITTPGCCTGCKDCMAKTYYIIYLRKDA